MNVSAEIFMGHSLSHTNDTNIRFNNNHFFNRLNFDIWYIVNVLGMLEISLCEFEFFFFIFSLQKEKCVHNRGTNENVFYDNIKHFSMKMFSHEIHNQLKLNATTVESENLNFIVLLRNEMNKNLREFNGKNVIDSISNSVGRCCVWNSHKNIFYLTLETDVT